jgi:hypothetical protein
VHARSHPGPRRPSPRRGPASAASALAVAAALALPTQGGAQAPERTYCNARFAYCVQYPGGLLRPLPEADNGDGRAFRARDPRVRVLVFGAPEAPPRTLRNGYRTAVAVIRAQRGRFLVRRLTRTRYVVSGTVDGGRTTLYETGRRERVRGRPVLQTLVVRYPSATRAVWRPVSLRMAASLR